MSSSFPRKEQRQKCYAARDQFWNCLDQNKDNGGGPELCAEFKKMFESECPAQWVTHFDRKYKYLKFKEQIETGFDPIGDDDSQKSKF